ncbi:MULTISPECIES: rRNA maturation RNase YbeY [Sulfurimonas]|uniref:rRNA maturation RNase YbeY n=1 Tax=Sulfurimonas TaxID=202746 RepID=UPI0012630AB8|nr:rRNA maturation RNase YbeY [Sulfurimonas indica]
MIDIDNQTSYEVKETLLQKIAKSLTEKDIELIITDNASIQVMNAEYRDIDKPTDVLSFPYDAAMQMAPLGSIVISYDFVQEKAKEFQHHEDDEFTLLFIHGLLHILGYDHECDNGEMRQKEEEIIKAFSLPQSLIVRTEG